MPTYRSPYDVGPTRPEARGEPAPRTAALAVPTAQGSPRVDHGRLCALASELANLTRAPR